MGRDWQLREVPKELVSRYVGEGWWNDQSLGEMVAERLARKPNAAFAVHSAVRPWRGTMADVDRAARAFATSLRAKGIGAGDVVVFQLPNWVEAAIAFWAAAYAGAVVVPVVHFYGAKELEYIVRVTAPDVVITPDRFGSIEYLPAYEPLLSGRVPWLVVGDRDPASLPPGATPFAAELDAEPLATPVSVDPDSLAIIAFTSGTTRDPKGVMHSHRTIGFESRQLSEMTDRGGPPPLTGAPVGHFMGMLGAFLSSLHRTHGVHLVDVWDPTQVLRLMLAESIGVPGGSPYFLTSLLDHPDFTDEHLALIPFFGMGGATVPVAVTERATGLGITVFRSYGSTEHPSVTGSMPDAPLEKRLQTDGQPMVGAEVRLDGDAQIHTRGPELCLGYTDAALTAEVFDNEGWYATGDVGVFDDDGYLTITDRISDVIIRGGENISAQEVEELLMGLDGVAEVAVVAAPDARLGEHAAAVMRLRDGQSPPTLEAMRAHLAAAGMAKQKWPESIYKVDELPRTPSGKVQKFRLRQQLRDGELTDNPPPLRARIVSEFGRQFGRQFGLDLAAEELAGFGVGQFVDEHDALGRLRTAERFTGERPQLLGVEVGSRPADHRGGNLLTPLLVGDADHRAVRDRRVAYQHVLDLGRRDVLAAANDRVVGPALDEEVALVVQPAPVPGREPAARIEWRRLPVVFARDLLAAHPDLTVANVDLDCRQHLPRRREPRHRGRVAVSRGPVILGAEYRDRRTRLGQAVGVGEPDVGQQLHHPLEHGRRRLGAAVGQGSQARQPGAVGLEHLGDAGKHRRNHHGVGDAVVAHRGDPGRRVELRQVHDATAAVEVAQQVGQTSDVIRRDAHQHRVVLVGAGKLDRVDDVRRQVAVPQDRGFRRRGRTTGEQQDRRPVRIVGNLADLGVLASERAERAGVDDTMPTRGQPGAHLAFGDHDRRTETAEQLVQLLLTEPVVER